MLSSTIRLSIYHFESLKMCMASKHFRITIGYFRAFQPKIDKETSLTTILRGRNLARVNTNSFLLNHWGITRSLNFVRSNDVNLVLCIWWNSCINFDHKWNRLKFEWISSITLMMENLQLSSSVLIIFIYANRSNLFPVQISVCISACFIFCFS